MRLLTALLLAALPVASPAGPQPPAVSDLFRPPPFDARAHLCGGDEPDLLRPDQVAALNDYLGDPRHVAETLSPEDCDSIRTRIIDATVHARDDAEMAGQALAFAGFWVSRSRNAEGFEARYANDGEMLIYAALLCDALKNDRRGCLDALISRMAPPFLADSPVFCDFAPPEARAPEAFGPAPGPAGRADLPGLCGALLGEGAAPVPQATSAWFARLEGRLFPPPPDGE